MTRRRSASTLLECLVVFTLFAGVFTTITLTIHTLYRAEVHLRRTWEDERSVGRFVLQWRRDTHQARVASVNAQRDVGDPSVLSQLLLTHPDDTKIQYNVGPAGIERIVLRDESVLHRETFPFKLSPDATWRIRTDHHHPITSLVVGPQLGEDPGETPTVPTQRFEAVVGLCLPSRPDQGG